MTKIITVTGDLGSGKSTVTKAYSLRKGIRRYSTGDIWREMAAARGISVLELNKLSETDPSIDEETDQSYVNLEKAQEDLIVDARLAWHFIKNNFKVKLMVDTKEAAKRIFQDTSRRSEDQTSVETVYENLLKRRESERARYQEKYSVDLQDHNNFDLVIYTDRVPANAVTDLIDWSAQRHFAGEPVQKYWASPELFLPLKPINYIASPESVRIRKDIAARGYDYTKPIETFLRDGYLFISDGHKLVSGSLLSKISIIPFLNVTQSRSGEDEDKFLKNNYKLNFVRDWEDGHNFRFIHYPKG